MCQTHNTLQVKNRLLILTGPQGSGNHLWSKIFSAHPFVNGWRMKEYWEGHHLEPFSAWWDDPSLIKDTGHRFNFTSISCPYFRDREPRIPSYYAFIQNAKKIYDVKIAVISRDQNILKTQQERVRGGKTYDKFLKQLPYLEADFFLSTEALFLYKENYLTHLSKILNIPVWIEGHDLFDTNKKYISSVEQQPLDLIVKKVCSES